MTGPEATWLALHRQACSIARFNCLIRGLTPQSFPLDRGLSRTCLPRQRPLPSFGLACNRAGSNIGLLKNPPMNTINTIIDIYHGNAIDFAKAKQIGIINKN